MISILERPKESFRARLTDRSFMSLQRERLVSFYLKEKRFSLPFSPYQQVVNAQKWNAKGLLLYVDPADYASQDTIRNLPEIIDWYPSNEVESGGLSVNKGDSLTPGYPATGESMSMWTAGTSTR